MVSFTAAGRAAAFAVSRRTSWITSVTRACFCSAAKRTVAMPTATPVRLTARTTFKYGEEVFVRVIVDLITARDPRHRGAGHWTTVAGSSRQRRQTFRLCPSTRSLQNRNSLDDL